MRINDWRCRARVTFLGKIALSSSHRPRSTVAAVPVLFAHAVVTEAKTTSEFSTPGNHNNKVITTPLPQAWNAGDMSPTGRSRRSDPRSSASRFRACTQSNVYRRLGACCMLQKNSVCVLAGFQQKQKRRRQKAEREPTAYAQRWPCKKRKRTGRTPLLCTL